MNETLINLLLEYNTEYAKNLWPGTLFCVVCLTIGLFGNGYVVFIYKFKLKDQTESRYFIPYLAMADASCSFISCFSVIFDNYHFLYYPWNSVCKGMLFSSGVAGYVSTLFLLAIAVQRFTTIKKKHFTLNQRRAAIGAILAFSIFCSIPFLLIAGVEEGSRQLEGVNVTTVKCGTLNGQYPQFETVYFILFAAFLVLNAMVMLGLYVPVAMVVYRRYRSTKRSFKISKSSASSEKDTTTTEITPDAEMDSIETPKRSVQTTDNSFSAPEIKSSSYCCNLGKAKTSKSGAPSHSTNFNVMFMTIVAMYALTYLPTAVIMVFVILQGDLDNLVDVPLWKLQLYGILGRFYIINNIVNPFIYGFFDVYFRYHFTNLLCCFRCREQK